MQSEATESTSNETIPIEDCGNAVSQVIESFGSLFNSIYTANSYLGSVFLIACLCLLFYIVYSLNNNKVAAAFSAIFGRGGGS